MNVFQAARLFNLQRRLREHGRWNRERLESYQARALHDLRAHAYARSPFYEDFHRGFMDSPLQELPVLTKSVLMEHWDEIVTDRSVSLADVQAFLSGIGANGGARLFRNRYRVAATAGSTGLRGVFIYDAAEWLHVLASYMRASDWAGIKTGIFLRKKVAIVSTLTPWHQSALVGAAMGDWSGPTLRLDSTEPIQTITGKLNQFQPQALVVYASLAATLALEQIAGRLRISPEAIFCTSDVLTDDSRRLVRQAWGTEPFNIYGATETAGIASECSQHSDMHLYEDLVIAESVHEDNSPTRQGEYGDKLLVTVLFSRTLPLIRYELSDSVRFSTRRCACHCPFSMISDIQGRTEEVMYLAGSSGKRVAIQPNVFHNVTENLPIGGWQVIQKPGNTLIVNVLDPAADFSEAALRERVSAALAEQGVERAILEIEYVRELSRTALGKLVLVKALKE